MSYYRPAKTPAEQSASRAIKAGLTAARKKFDKSPTADAWNTMLIWSLAWQQIGTARGITAAVAVMFATETSHTNTAMLNSPVFPVAVLKALHPDQSIAELIRS